MTGLPGVGCGAWIEEDGKVLLVLRLKAPEKTLWNLPGGKIDWNERAEAAVVREVAEETGLTIALHGLLCLTQMMEPGHHWIAPVFQATVVAGEARNVEPAKHGDVRWWPVAALPSNLGQAARDARAARQAAAR
ncbi:NUDIX domain-containing protein [uncultured Alsobacter sp.]|uniref:NUDIX domain-containing protein n=1 Tax=uncultured Alsobacter sp. TaxID=1748258 RepID=UPI0025EA2A30|nr:NUDIX domain-containing protein [uncultured Alsobacter sp.]